MQLKSFPSGSSKIIVTVCILYKCSALYVCCVSMSVHLSVDPSRLTSPEAQLVNNRVEHRSVEGRRKSSSAFSSSSSSADRQNVLIVDKPKKEPKPKKTRVKKEPEQRLPVDFPTKVGTC